MAMLPWAKGAKLALHLAPSLSPPVVKPLVLLSGWMGSTSRNLQRINDAYEERGFDTMSFSAGPGEVLNPLNGAKLIESTLDKVADELTRTNEANRSENPNAKARPLVFHGFSMSGFLWGNALLAMDKDPERYLTATANTAGVHHRNASDRFHSNGLTDVPSLWFYSKADVVATAEVVFEDTPHVQHLLLEREKYLAGLDAFLAKHRLL